MTFGSSDFCEQEERVEKNKTIRRQDDPKSNTKSISHLN